MGRPQVGIGVAQWAGTTLDGLWPVLRGHASVRPRSRQASRVARGSPNKRHFAFTESKLPQMADNGSYVNYIHLHTRTKPNYPYTRSDRPAELTDRTSQIPPRRFARADVCTRRSNVAALTSSSG